MNKLYNTQEDFAINFNNFLKNFFPNIRKTQLNILPYIIYGMSKAESSSAVDIAKELKESFSFVKLPSKIKRIRRFFNNKIFNPEEFYDTIIRHVINNYTKKHNDNRVHIIIDHMFSHDNYTTLMFSMRVGNQGAPIWFRSFKGKKNGKAFDENLILEGINYTIDLFKNSNLSLIFLADRWFNSTNIMKNIHDANHIFCFRMKTNIKALVYDKNENHDIWKFLSNFTIYKYHSVLYENVLLTENKFKCNIVCSKSNDTDRPWIIATNGDYKHTIKDYSYRFGGIETIFKNQKSNGFYIESIVNASEKSYQTMYALVCNCILFHTILGAEYSKNKSKYKHIDIETHKYYKKKGKVSVISLFNTGLILFKEASYSYVKTTIPIKFILYDV